MSHPDWKSLPDRLQSDPGLTSFRIGHLESRVTNLEKDWVAQPEIVSMETPMGKVPVVLLKIALIGVLGLLALRPELGATFLAKLP
jgi:hypothetical protein